MPMNVWSAGQDGLLGFLADRDAKQRLAEDRSRRDRLDAEGLQDRNRQREIQEGQLKSIDADREARRAAEAAEAAAKGKEAEAKALNAAQIGQLLDAYDAAKTPEEKQSIGMRILNAGGKLAPEPRAPQRDPIADHLAKKKIDQQFKEPKAPTGPKDDPTLPRGVRTWIESIAQRGVPLEQARTELSQGWGQQRQAHPNASLAAAAAELMKLYPAQNPNQVREPIAPPPAAAAPQPSPAAPAAGGNPQEAAAIKFLTDAGAPVTPANIAATIQRLAGGQ